MAYKDIAVVCLQKGKGIAIEIVNQEIADSFRAYFEEFWNGAKPFRR